MNKNYLNIVLNYNHNFLQKNRSFDLNQMMKNQNLVN